MTNSAEVDPEKNDERHNPKQGQSPTVSPGGPPVGRRSVLAFLFGAVVGGFIEESVSKPAVDLAKGRILKGLRPEGTTIAPSVLERARLAFELFLSSRAPTEFIPPRVWDHAPPDVALGDGTYTYEHEYEVLRSIAGVMSSAPVTWDVRNDSWLAHTDCSQVALASGQSNEASRWLIGMADSPIWSPKVGERTIELAYSISRGTGRLKRWQYGEEIERHSLAVCNREGRSLAQAQASDGWQQDDYLLVTRLPGPKPNTVLTVLAGLHGPGTRSAEMLFSAVSARDLEDLASRIGHKSGVVPHFQAVFRASRFQRIRGSDVATHMELVTEGCPPRRLD